MGRLHVLDLDSSYFIANSREVLQQALDRAFASTDYILDELARTAQLNGPRSDYIDLDTKLNDTLGDFGVTTPSELRHYHTRQPHFDLCFEDSWTGVSLARILADIGNDDLILIHLDDHADMMPCLLEVSDNGTLVDPVFKTTFDTSDARDWDEAIRAGVINIGSYLTPLFHRGANEAIQPKTHLRHIRPTPTGAERLRSIAPAKLRHAPLGTTPFATLRFGEPCPDMSTHLETRHFASALRDLPKGHVVVHIDLDYFMNDFNGNPRTKPTVLTRDDIEKITSQMDSLMEQLAKLNRPVVSWIIATSPGFCASRHWKWLLLQLEDRIRMIGFRNI